MKTNEKQALVDAARIAGSEDNDDFWQEVQDKLTALEKTEEDRVKPRDERLS